MWIYQNKNIRIDSQVFTSTKDPSSIITGDTIGMIVGVILSCLIIIAIVISIAYFCPWLRCYKIFCWRCAFLKCCDCIQCYDSFPFLEKRAFNNYISDNIKSNKIYEQDFITTSDGRIVEAGEIRPATGISIKAIQNKEDEDGFKS